MTGLVSPPPGADPGGASVHADGWFPAVTLASVRNTFRLGEGVVPTARLTEAVEGAMLSAFRALADWRTARVLRGALTLTEVTELTLNNRNLAVVLWERIIRCFAAAELADLHRDLSATDDGLDRAEERALTADDYRRMAYAAIADLQSIGGDAVQRCRVSLV